MSDPDVVEVAVFGKQVEFFLQSEVGLYLTQCCRAEVDAAMEKLKVVDPTDPVAVQKLQNKVVMAESIMGWLSDALHAGEQASDALKERP